MSCWSRSNEAPQRLNRLTLVPSCPQWTPRVLLSGQTWSTCPHAQRTPGWPLTLFKLYPNTRVILDLLDHLSTPADDHPHRMPGHWHLRVGGMQESQLGSVPSLRPSAAQHPPPPAHPGTPSTWGSLHSHRCPRRSGIHTRSGPRSHPGHAPEGCPSPSHRLAANTRSTALT